MKKLVLLAGIFIFGIFLAGCTSLTIPIQPSHTIEAKELSAVREYGQTFFAREDGLTGIDIYIEKVKHAGTVQLDLFAIDNRDEPIQSSEKTINADLQNEYITFDFDQAIPSLNKDYYLKLSVPGAAVVDIGNGYADVYSSGSMYENGEPIERQLAFLLRFNKLKVVSGLMSTFMQWVVWILIAVILFFIPGFALFKLLWSQKTMSLGSTIGLSFGIGAAIYPVWLLWTNVFGVQLRQWNVWVIVVPSLIYTSSVIAKKIKNIKQPIRLKTLIFTDGKTWTLLAYLLVAAAVIFTRFWVIRGLEMPMWGDSYQHAMITQLILDNGGLFQSWLPYVPYETLTVQYGFPTASALFAWVSGESSVYATLITGQIFNILAILALFPLAEKISKKNAWSGIFVMAIAGVFSLMPAMYVNWGRYAQLSGQVVLPILIWMIWELIEIKNQFEWKQVFLSGLVLGGMSLNYYRTPFIFAFFVLAVILIFLVKYWRDKTFWLHVIKINLLLLIIAVLLLLPWGAKLLGSNLSSALEAGITTEIPLQSVINDYQAWLGIKNYVHPVFIVFGILAIALAAFQRNRNVLVVFLWTVFISAYKFTQIYNFPGANMMQSFSILIMLYIPVSLLAGYFLGESIKLIPWRKNLIVFVILLVALVPGLNAARKIVNEPFFAIVKRPDLRAMAWIRENTKTDSTFLIEGFRIYNGNSTVGSDGGWYIPLLAGRQNTIPPQYALLNERAIDPDYTDRVTERVKIIEEEGLLTLIPEFCKGELSHIYIGQDHGLVGENNPKLFDEEDIDLEYFTLVYQEDRVRIYQFKEWICGDE